MAKKNGNGEGSRPRERSYGRWEARYWVDGKRRSVYGSTRKEAADKLARAIADSERKLRNCLENSWMGLDSVFWVSQISDKDAFRPVLPTRGIQSGAYSDLPNSFSRHFGE